MRFRPLRFARGLISLPFVALGAVARGVVAVPGRVAYRLHHWVNRSHYDALRRGAFRFWTGTRWRTVDPLVAWMSLNDQLKPAFAALLTSVSTAAPADATPEQTDAHESQRAEDAARLADAAAVAFGLKVAGSLGATGDDDEWLTRAELLRLVTLLLRFLAEGRHLGGDE